jgi:hypothetical protein
MISLAREKDIAVPFWGNWNLLMAWAQMTDYPPMMSFLGGGVTQLP